MKELIKQLASEQPALKKARKTGTMPDPLPMLYGWLDFDKLPDNIVEAIRAAGKVRANKAKITAALNIMHELRGSDYRHGYSKYEYLYNSYYKEFETLKEIIANE